MDGLIIVYVAAKAIYFLISTLKNLCIYLQGNL